MKVTVFTPTYNRSKELLRVYKSLCKQTNKNFEWIIVDDGSIDDTKIIIDEIKNNENGFPILYFYKSNGGKFTAHNYAVSKASNDLFLCVDSDDFIVDDAIEIIINCAQNLFENNSIGIIAMKQEIKGRILSDIFPKNIKQCKKIELQQIYKCTGEFTLIYKTDILKKCLYPEIKDERFVGENVIYDMLDQYGEMLLLNKVITVCEYLENGYTYNFKKIMLNNPTGYKLYYMQRIDLAITFKECINYIIRYNAFSILSKSKLYNYKGKKKVFVYLLKPIGYIASLYYKMKS